ncbi:unnamed protein product [Urochloa humidicola]
MEGGPHREIFSQEGSSEGGYFPIPFSMYADEVRGSNYSPPAPPRSQMGILDLNYNAESFTEMLQAGVGRSARPSFVAPRQSQLGAGVRGAARGSGS